MWTSADESKQIAEPTETAAGSCARSPLPAICLFRAPVGEIVATDKEKDRDTEELQQFAGPLCSSLSLFHLVFPLWMLLPL